MSNVLHYAFEYRDMGLSVIPLNGKTPSIPWKEFQERLATTAELKKWFATTRHNIGIVTGQISGVMAFDIDSAETGKRFFGKVPESQMMTRSQNGRGHVYYQLPKDLILGNRVKIKGMGALDIRAEGGQCVATPSIHPETGKPYQRVGSWNLSETPYFDPEWIEEETSPICDFKETLSVPTNGERITSLESYLSAIKSIQGQHGSKGLFRVCCIARDETGDFETAYRYVKDWNASGAAVPPWTEKELLHSLENAFKKTSA